MARPDRIGRLHVERPLGAGGFATVWLAHDPDLDDAVAVKVLAENWTAHAEIRRRFVDEARLLRRVDSDHLVRVYDIGELPDGRPYFVMTHADRGSLAERTAGRPAPWAPDHVLGVVDSVVAGLAVLHGHGIVHRDVKPSNILLRSGPGGERVLLGDLGIAKDLRWASGITMPAGSERYMPPEQRAYSDQIGPASDVHALAVTAGQLLGLAPPWPASPVGQVLQRATWPDPAGRTASVVDFAAELRTVLQAVASAGTAAAVATAATWMTTATTPAPAGPPPAPTGPRPTSPGEPSSPVRGRRPRRRLVLGAAAAVILLLAGAGWWGYDRGRSISPSAGHVTVRVPWTWTQTTPIVFPEGNDDNEGLTAGSGGRTISVAWTSPFVQPASAVAAPHPAGCTRSGAHPLTVGPRTWNVVRYTGCPDGATVDEAAAGDQANDWTVWVEVRARDGDPDLASVLASVRVS